MDVVWNKPISKLFRELCVGDVFSHNGILYMVIQRVTNDGEESFNAVNLENGSIRYFFNDDKVIVHNCEIVVK